MGSLRNFLTDMQKLASVNPAKELEKQAEYKTLMALSMLKEAQELAEMAAAEEMPMEESMDEGLGEEGKIDEEALIEILSELVNNVDTLDEDEQGSVLDAADALEDQELAAGEKTSTVMDYVALLNYLGIK